MSTNWAQPVTFYEGENPAQFKAAFVEYKARHPLADDFDIASKVFEGCQHAAQRAGQAAVAWGRDLDVLQSVSELKRNGSLDESVVSKEQLSIEILALARNEFQVPIKERLEAYKLVATINGFIEKGGTQVNVQVNRVMQVRDHGSDEAWEERTRAQQARLVNGV